jgi:ferredoxin
VGRLTLEPNIFSGEISPTKTVLQVMLENRCAISHVCRRGLCGQDLIRVLKGWEYLNPIEDHEEGTLILMMANDEPMRMACCTRVIGEGEVVIEIVR